MRSCTARPLLLIDVDGVVSLFGFTHLPPAGLLPTAVEGVPHLLSAHAGSLLLRLAATFECVWCTGWEERAEEHLPRLLGLPGGWPHLSFDSDPGTPPRHWKLAAIESHAGPDRPLAWIDDMFDPTCDAWVAGRAAPTLLVRTEPATGLREEHVTRLEAWARRL
jgi:HAD domain in Swiss Army Knife RNA repair proteins